MKTWEKALLIFPLIFYGVVSTSYFVQPMVCDVNDLCITSVDAFGALTDRFILFYGIPATGYLIYRKLKKKSKQPTKT